MPPSQMPLLCVKIIKSNPINSKFFSKVEHTMLAVFIMAKLNGELD
jgi:hypothetical protein